MIKTIKSIRNISNCTKKRKDLRWTNSGFSLATERVRLWILLFIKSFLRILNSQGHSFRKEMIRTSWNAWRTGLVSLKSNIVESDGLKCLRKVTMLPTFKYLLNAWKDILLKKDKEINCSYKLKKIISTNCKVMNQSATIFIFWRETSLYSTAKHSQETTCNWHKECSTTQRQLSEHLMPYRSHFMAVQSLST